MAASRKRKAQGRTKAARAGSSRSGATRPVARRAPAAPGGSGTRSGPASRPSRQRQDRLRAAPVSGTPAIVRGASWGFSILLVGELIALQLLGLGNGLILYVVAAAAYALAGNRAVQPPVASVARAGRDGALAAAAAYALTIPLRLMVRSASTSLVATAVALLFAVVVGGLAGSIVGKARLDEQGAGDGRGAGS